MNPKARIAILNGLNNKDKRVSDFARHLIDREEMGASDATDSSTRVMALVRQRRKQSPDYTDAEMANVCVAKPRAHAGAVDLGQPALLSEKRHLFTSQPHFQANKAGASSESLTVHDEAVDHVPDAGKMVDRLSPPAQPSIGPVKATPDDFAAWSEQAKQEEREP